MQLRRVKIDSNSHCKRILCKALPTAPRVNQAVLYPQRHGMPVRTAKAVQVVEVLEAVIDAVPAEVVPVRMAKTGRLPEGITHALGSGAREAHS